MDTLRIFLSSNYYFSFLSRFSVDFAAHISYHYLDSEGTPDEKVKNSLYGLGLPIMQGAISTILGVIGLMIAPSYIFITFFKMVFLVIVLGALHGLFLLPVLLSLFGPGSCTKEEKQKIKSPATSYMSDGESLQNKSKRRSPNLDFGEEGLRIPRPITTISLSTATPTDAETSGSSPGSGQVQTKQEKQRKSRRSRQQNLHEMYHNNGYVSEEEAEEMSGTRSWRSHPRGSGPVLYYNHYPGTHFPPYAHPADRTHSTRAADRTASHRTRVSQSADRAGSHRTRSSHSAERAGSHSTRESRCRSNSKECKKKKPKH